MAALFPPIPLDAPPPQGAEERFVHSLAQLPDQGRVYHRLSWYDTSTGGVRGGAPRRETRSRSSKPLLQRDG